VKTLSQLRICITGSFGYKDIGDEAMLTEDLDFIVSSLGVRRENIDLIGGHPDYVSTYHGHPIEHCFPSWWFERRLLSKRRGIARRLVSSVRRLRHGLPAVARRARQCDLLLVSGGGTVNTRDPEGSSLKRMHALVTHFKGLGKPVFMSGQTIGPLGLRDDHDRLAAEIISAVDVLTVRDSHYSRRYIDIIQAKPKQFLETFDDASSLDCEGEVLPADVARFLQLGAAAAVNVTEYTADTSERRVFIANLCEHLIRHHGLNVVLVSHDVADYFNLNVIRDMMANDLKDRAFLPDTRLWRDRTVKKMISCCRLAVGGRYHFIVFAGTSNTPFVGMCGNHYSYIKQDGFARPHGLADFILTEKETWDLDVVKSRIAQALDLNLTIEQSLPRPSASMRVFGEWVQALAAAKRQPVPSAAGRRRDQRSPLPLTAQG